MIAIPSYLRNHEAVVSAFGYWPNFHDAPVHTLQYSKLPPGCVELVVHAWEMTPETDARGYFKLVKHHMIMFVFYQILDADLGRFTDGNILFSLGFSTPLEFAVSGNFRVTLESAIGADLCGAFSARVGEIIEVVPCDARGNKTDHVSAPIGGPATLVRNSDSG